MIITIIINLYLHIKKRTQNAVPIIKSTVKKDEFPPTIACYRSILKSFKKLF